jgi:hypothetical protein
MAGGFQRIMIIVIGLLVHIKSQLKFGTYLGQSSGFLRHFWAWFIIKKEFNIGLRLSYYQ